MQSGALDLQKKQIELKDTQAMQATMQQPVGGMDKIPMAMKSKLAPGVLHQGCEVRKIARKTLASGKTGVEITYLDKASRQIKTAVADYYAQKGTWPVAGVATVGAGSIGMSAAPTGKYVTVDLSDALGGVQITFNGPQVNATISGKKLGLNAALSTNGDIVWKCGTAGAAGATVSGTAATDLATKYLPSACKA